MAFNPELGSTSPAVLLDNAERLDKLVNGPAADDMTLADAQADIANIPAGSTTYVRSQDGSSLADEYINNGGTLTATGRHMPSGAAVELMSDTVQRLMTALH
ncbi:hypothetical protein ACSJH1_09540, partial [Klebsiella pneumoniae]